MIWVSLKATYFVEFIEGFEIEREFLFLWLIRL